jgi:hypothetical protein
VLFVEVGLQSLDMCKVVRERLRYGSIVDECVSNRFWGWIWSIQGDGSGGESM